MQKKKNVSQTNLSICILGFTEMCDFIPMNNDYLNWLIKLSNIEQILSNNETLPFTIYHHNSLGENVSHQIFLI